MFKRYVYLELDRKQKLCIYIKQELVKFNCNLALRSDDYLFGISLSLEQRQYSRGLRRQFHRMSIMILIKAA